MRTDSYFQNKIKYQVQEYYGKELKGTNDLKTSVCCSTEEVPFWQREILKEIEPEILEKFYGCGSPIPLAVKNKTVLDLGCGTGRDVYINSKLVGEDGFVIGIDMTEEQLNCAKKYVPIQTKKFGFQKPNVEFKKGFIEDLKECGIEDNSIDVVTSNCVINLSGNKEAVFKEIFRVLKNGGEVYLSDVFSDRRIPKEFINDKVLYGECLSNAIYIEDFRRLLTKIGINDFRIISKRKINLENSEVENKIGFINFYSITLRAFKLLNLEDRCEDYGQAATYLGTIKHAPYKFNLDDHHIFETGKPMLVCGNTFDMISNSRFSEHFKLAGDKSKHFGLFPCVSNENIEESNCSNGSCC